MAQYFYLLGKWLAISHLVAAIIYILLLAKVPQALTLTTCLQILVLAAVLGFLNYGLFFIIGKVLELIKSRAKANNLPELFSKELEKAEFNQAKEEVKDS